MRLEAAPSPTARWWDDVDRLVAALPPALFRQVKLLEYDLSLRYSKTGQFHDVFPGPEEPPALSVASWILHDLDMPAGAVRDETERDLFVASVLLAMRVQAVDGLLDPGAFTTDDRIALVQWLSERATAEIARVVPGGSTFWESHEQLIAEDAVRIAAYLDPAPGAAGATNEEPEAYLASRLSAPIGLVSLAALAAADRLEFSAPVAEMLDEMADAYQAVADLESLTQDLQRGHISYAIAFIARAARIPLHPAPRPEVLLGAMVATGSSHRIVQTALDRLRRARSAAVDLRLPTFVAFLSNAQASIEARLASWTPGSPRDGSARPEPLVRQSIPPLSQALGMAEGFLLADPTFRESWETHREGMLGEREVASRFPAGLILETLCRNGLDVRRGVDAFLDFTVANGFRYYDHPRSGVDADTIGVFLRLREFGTANEAHGGAVGAVLECLARNVSAAGTIPVWLTDCANRGESESAVIALGESCATVSAHLLLGLLAAGGAQTTSVTIGARHLVDRLTSVGVAANVNYPPVYALGVFFRLLGRLGVAGGSRSVSGLEAAKGTLTADLERTAHQRPMTAQDAALLIGACHDANRQGLIDPGWLAQVLKRQRFDGSWTGEPFAAAPNRGTSVSWYSSTILTTALCFDALNREAKRLPAVPD